MPYLITDTWNSTWLNYFFWGISILGVLYLAVDFLDQKYVLLKAVTQGLTFGILCALFFFLTFLLIDLLEAFNYFIIYKTIHLYAFLKDDLASFDPFFFDIEVKYAIPNGMLDGLIVGASYILIRNHIKPKFLVRTSFLFIFSLLLIIGTSVVFELMNLNKDINPGLGLIALTIGDIGGFMLGIVISRENFSWQRISITCIFALILLISLFSIIRYNYNYMFEDTLYYLLYYSIFGIVCGIAFEGWLQPQKFIKINSWPRVKMRPVNFIKLHLQKFTEMNSWIIFIFWLATLGLALPLIFLFYYGINSQNYTFIYALFYFFLLFGIANGKGERILKRLKLRCKYLVHIDPHENDKIYPTIDFKKFRYGLAIGTLYFLPTCIFFLFSDYLFKASQTTIIYDLFLDIGYSIQLGLLIGCIFCFGPYIIYHIEHLSRDKFGKIGVIIAVLGAILTGLPNLFK